MSRFAGLGLAVEQTARMTITSPVTGMPLRLKGADGKDTEETAWIELLSLDSETARRHQRAAQDRRLGQRARKLKAEELDAEGLEQLVALTKDWRLADLSGAPLDIACDPAAARELYGTPAFAWLKEQVDLFVADRGNWRPTSSTN